MWLMGSFIPTTIPTPKTYIFCVQIKTHITLFCWHPFFNTEQIESIRYPSRLETILVGSDLIN